MRTAITIVREHGKKEFKMAHDPSVPILKQQEEFKKHRAAGQVHEKIAEVQYWESGGPMRSWKFITPTERKARVEAQAKAEAEAKERADKLAKAKKEEPAKKQG